MITFLLIISILVNIIAILSIIVLYSRQNRLLEFEKNQNVAQRELEELISAFVIEIKEENQQLLSHLSNQNQKVTRTEAKLEYSINTKPDVDKLDIKPINHTMKQALRQYEKGKGQTDPLQSKEEQIDQSIVAQQDNSENLILVKARKLQLEGRSIEEIARILNKGKTEIDLLLKFSNR